MKSLVLAALMGLSIAGAGSAASAQPPQNGYHEDVRQGGGMRRDESIRRDNRDDRNWRDDRRDDRNWRDDRGMRRHVGWNNDRRHYGWRNHRRCTWVWRHHQRVRRCW
ncbi:hypothetical protein ACFSCW_04185 [Sphingomonas tabacisoli]|uniref:Uncharacterized protein n=1 Tax=Sphingomonas tabacisoli TaxID=2249466 RepID=A0ABW4I0N4_9SPHN